MKAEAFIGKTLNELATQTSIFSKAVRVFVLQDDNDDTGKRLMDVFRIQQVISKHPAAAEATVIFAKDYYGETILRVKI